MEDEEKILSEEELRELVRRVMEEPSDDISYNDEEKDMVMNLLNKKFSIAEAIQMQKENEEFAKRSFDACKGTYKSVSFHRNGCIKNICYTKFKLLLVKFMGNVVNMDVSDSIDSDVKKINDTHLLIKQEKELLKEIKNSINELKKYRITLCNYDIFMLLVMIYNFNEKLIMDLSEHIKQNSLAMQGINYIGNKPYKDELEDLENKIDEYKLKLGLTK